MTRNILNFVLGRSRLVWKEIVFFKEKFSQSTRSLSLSKTGRRLKGYLILNLYSIFLKVFKRYLKILKQLFSYKAKILIYRER
jgi:hypothetical protein